jgi:hypothetical protein
MAMVAPAQRMPSTDGGHVTQPRGDDVAARGGCLGDVADQAAAGTYRQAVVGYQRRGVDAIGQHHVVRHDGRVIADDAPAFVAVFQPFDGEIVAAFDPGQQGAAEAGRIDPAARGEPPAALCHRPAGERGGFLAPDVAAVLRRQRMGFDDGALAFLVLGIARDVQHPGPAGAHAGQCAETAAAEQEAGLQQPPQPSLVERGQGAEHAGMVARGANGGLRPFVDHDDFVAARRQRLRGGGTGDAGADYGDAAPDESRRWRYGAGQAGRQHLALVGEAGAPFRCETGGRETAPHLAGDGPAGQRGTGRSQAPQLGDDVIAPQVGVPVGREAVEVDRVGGQRQLRQQVVRRRRSPV